MWSNLLEARTPSDRLELEWPLGSDQACVIVHGFLSVDECERLIAQAERTGFVSASPDYPPSYRDNDRLVLDDFGLSSALFARLRQCIAQSPPLASVSTQPPWTLLAVNERMRFCRYRPGTQFGAHQDGVHYRPQSQSRLTFMVYLNESVFTGGDTVFYGNRADAMAGVNATTRFRPRQGSLILFDHALWHAGAKVESGLKYVMRSDLMYTAATEAASSADFASGHQGYVWALSALSEGRIASAGRDTLIRIWDQQGRLHRALCGHTQSVLGVLEMQAGELLSYSRDRTVRRWSLSTGASEILGEASAALLSGTQLGPAQLVLGDAAGFLQLWDLSANTKIQWLAHRSWIWAIESVDAQQFASVSEDGWLRIWNAVIGHEVCHRALDRPLRSVACSGNEAEVCLAVGDLSGDVHLLSMHGTTLAPVRTFRAHSGAVRKLRFERDSVLLSCGEDGAVRRWDLCSDRFEQIVSHDNFATDVLCLGPGHWLSSGYDGQIRVTQRELAP